MHVEAICDCVSDATFGARCTAHVASPEYHTLTQQIFSPTVLSFVYTGCKPSKQLSLQCSQCQNRVPELTENN